MVWVYDCFYQWMRINHPFIKFEWYADDTVCHCRSRKEAESLLETLSDRFSSCRLSLNVEKTEIVCCKNNRIRQNLLDISFDFLGHTFCPRKTMNRAQRKAFTRFLPDISQKAKKRIMEDFNLMLSRWAKAKYKRLKKMPVYLSLKWLCSIVKREPMFYHWTLGVYPRNVKCY